MYKGFWQITLFCITREGGGVARSSKGDREARNGNRIKIYNKWLMLEQKVFVQLLYCSGSQGIFHFWPEVIFKSTTMWLKTSTVSICLPFYLISSFFIVFLLFCILFVVNKTTLQNVYEFFLSFVMNVADFNRHCRTKEPSLSLCVFCDNCPHFLKRCFVLFLAL